MHFYGNVVLYMILFSVFQQFQCIEYHSRKSEFITKLSCVKLNVKNTVQLTEETKIRKISYCDAKYCISYENKRNNRINPFCQQ